MRYRRVFGVWSLFILGSILACVPPQKNPSKPSEAPATTLIAKDTSSRSSSPNTTPSAIPRSPCGSRSPFELIELPTKEIYRLPVPCQVHMMREVLRRYSFGLGEDIEKAIRHLKKMTELDPRLGRTFYLLAVAYYKSGDSKKAYETIMKIFEEDKPLSLSDALQAAEFLTYDLKKLEEAEKIAQIMLEQEPRYVEARMLHANILSAEGKKKEAEEAYRQVLKLFPRNAGAKLKLGELLLEQKKYAEAEKLLLESADVLYLSPIPFEKLALLYHAMGDQRKALAFLEKFREKGGEETLYRQLKREFLKNTP